MAGNVDRSAPRVLEPNVVEHRQEVAEVRDDPRDGVLVVGEGAADAAVVAGRADAAAERDPTVRGGAEVADREARVAQELPAGPPELGKAVGDRLGGDHVAAPPQQPAAEPRPAAGPRV